MMGAFDEKLKKRAEEAENIIAKYIPKPDGHNNHLLDAMSYSLLAGGKRLRPILMKSFFNLFCGKSDAVMPFMAAMEMLHTYSLVHDDLPAIDNDDYRRGLETTHKKYGEAVAVLAGDGLLHSAHEVVLEAFGMTEDTKVIDALKIFSRKTGINGMLGGQSVDVFSTGSVVSDDTMAYIYEKKTGALIEGSMMVGAALAGASHEDIDKVERIGACVGMAFQIEDDILDLYGDAAVLGKPINSDTKNNKKTYLSVHGLEKSRADIIKLTEEAVTLLNCLGNNDEERDFIKDLFDYMVIRSK